VTQAQTRIDHLAPSPKSSTVADRRGGLTQMPPTSQSQVTYYLDRAQLLTSTTPKYDSAYSTQYPRAERRHISILPRTPVGGRIHSRPHLRARLKWGRRGVGLVRVWWATTDSSSRPNRGYTSEGLSRCEDESIPGSRKLEVGGLRESSEEDGGKKQETVRGLERLAKFFLKTEA
jgi:hypothetical protein